MVNISELDGWKSGGTLAGNKIYKVIGTNSNGGVLHITISGPTEFSSTTYSVVVKQPGDVFGDFIEQGLESKTEAEIAALQYAQNNQSE